MTTYIDPMEGHPREEKLPRWAQLLIQNLREKTRWERARAEEARAATNPDETDTIYDAYSERGPIGLPKSETIRFYVGPDRRNHWVDVHVDRNGGNYLHLMAADSLWVAPQSGNTARVGTSDWANLRKGFRS